MSGRCFRRSCRTGSGARTAESRLRYRKAAGVITIGLVGLCGLAVVTFLRIYRPSATPRRALIGAAIVLVAYILVELATTWFLRNRRELELAGRGAARVVGAAAYSTRAWGGQGSGSAGESTWCLDISAPRQ